ncbi:biopolymer transporter ExbD, partial [Escherichia coli]|uniref:ExbD/TolR family protein n=1 Tax=Escherichia coli TaxID=562 RepID=UPI0028E00FC0
VAGTGFDKPIYVRADGKAPYAVVAQVMAAISAAGFAKIGLITDTGGPTSGARETKVDAAIAPGLPPAPR